MPTKNRQIIRLKRRNEKFLPAKNAKYTKLFDLFSRLLAYLAGKSEVL